MENFIHFFGTGNKDLFLTNIRSAGGLYLNIDDTKLIIDPRSKYFLPIQSYLS